MKLGLFYDTETSGLPLFNDPSEDPRQPHIVQVAARLVDMDARIAVAGFDLTVRPDGWTIPDEVAKVHGITTERAALIGVNEDTALLALMALWNAAQARIAHNETFDQRIVRIALKRYWQDDKDFMLERWAGGAVRCTANLSTKLCAIPPTPRMVAAGRTHFKTPNLREAHRILVGRDFDGAHSAGADVDACMRVYFAIADRQDARSSAANDAAAERPRPAA